jgi:hypothetical protein
MIINKLDSPAGVFELVLLARLRLKAATSQAQTNGMA